MHTLYAHLVSASEEKGLYHLYVCIPSGIQHIVGAL